MSKALTGLITAVVTAAALVSAPVPQAHAAIPMWPGMPIVIGNHECSLGFFAYNEENAKLAVTAGHCADGRSQPVTTEDRQKIGTTVLWKDDERMPNGEVDELSQRGYTVIQLADERGADSFFTGIGDVHPGDSVLLRGTTSGTSHGSITEAQSQLLFANIRQQPGDSGGPWYTADRRLVGIASSGERTGSGAYDAQAQPIRALVQDIRASGDHWGRGLMVLAGG